MTLFDEIASELIARGKPEIAEVYKKSIGEIKEYINGIKKISGKKSKIVELEKIKEKYSQIFIIKSAGCSLKMEQLSSDLRECENCKERKDIERIPCEGDEVLKKPEKKDKP